jgi:hypothetical protein
MHEMPARNKAVAVDPATDVTEVTDVTAVTEGGDVTEVTENATEAAEVAESMRINLHVLIDVDPAKWSLDSAGSTEARDNLKAILIAGGMDEAEALATANKVHKPSATTGPNAVRDAVKEYMLDEMRKLARIVEVGAEVNYYERPVKA